MIHIFKSRFIVALLLVCVIDPSLFSLSSAEGVLSVGIFRNTPVVYPDEATVIDEYINWIKTGSPAVSLMQSSTKHSVDEAQHYWTTAKTILFSMLIVLSIGVMAIWRYLSISRLNRELVATITERQRVEQDLRKSQEFLLEAQAIARLGRWQLDLASNTLSWSKGIYTLLEVRQGAFTGKHETFLSYAHPEDRGTLDRAYIDCVEKETMYSIEYRLLMSDGRIKWVSENTRIEYDESGKPRCLIGTVQDISERKLAEEVQSRCQSQLQHTQKMESLGALAGGIAHDFNNILTGVLGYAEMVKMDSPPDSIVAQNINNVINAGKRARDLVKQILAFSRQSENQVVPLQPGILVAETLKLLRPSLPSTITIKQAIDRDAGLILADPTKIHQVILNLYTNAFHAMEDKGGTLCVTVKKKSFTQEDLLDTPSIQPGTFVQISIQDTGAGISPAIRSKIFDPYFTTKAVGKGTGMGLAIVNSIITSYGGFINSQSKVGKGTVFHVNLPITSVHALPEPQTPELLPAGTEHILFIDDEEMLTEIGNVMLRRLGYRVTARTNSTEALNTFKNQPEAFDLVITDQTMPGMTGMALAKKILQIRPMVPIILCTGYSSLISKEEAKRMGIQGFALKPLSMNAFAVLIRQVLDTGKIMQERLTVKKRSRTSSLALQ